MKKKIIIVGGGITGLITAYYLKIKGYKDISIYEIKKNLGGILNDKILEKDFFFSSCQYLEVNSDWYKYIPSVLKKNQLYEFKHQYSSYTEDKNSINFTKDFAGPSFNHEPNFNNVDYKKDLLSRLNVYSENTKKFVKKWLDSINIDLEKLTSESSYGLALRRIYFKNNKKLISKKKFLKIFDETYGLKRQELNLNLLKAALPIKGYNNFFEEFEKILTLNQIRIFKRKPIKVSYLDKKLKIFSENTEIKYDYLLWSGNPTSIIKNVLKKNLDSFNIKSLNLFFLIKNIKIKTNYVQYFSLNSKINRIFFYESNKNTKITVECFDHKFQKNEIISHIIKILNYLKIKVDIKNIVFLGQENYKIYNILSCSDKKILKEFKSYHKEFNMINCGWEKYGRDLKFKEIFSSIKKII